MSTRSRVSALDTTPDRVEVSACCAPMTSLLSLLTSEPVWARVKNAIGCRCTCPNTWVRRSDRKSTRLNSSHVAISYAVFCLKKKKKTTSKQQTTEEMNQK